MNSTVPHKVTEFSEELLDLIRTGDLNEKLEEIIDKSSLYFATDASGSSLLHYSVKCNNIAVTKYLVNKNCDVDVQDLEGNTPLIIGVTKSYNPIIRILLLAGADMLKLNNKNQSAVYLLSLQDNILIASVLTMLYKLKEKISTSKELAEILLETKFNLYELILIKDADTIEQMLRQRSYPIDSAESIRKVTAIHHAVLLDDYKSVNLLLRYNCDVNALDYTDATPLYNLYKIKRKHNSAKIEILKNLVNAGAKMTSCTSHGLFQIINILTRGNREIIRVLFELGLDFNAKDAQSEKNVLHYISNNTNSGVIEELKPYVHKLDVNLVDKFGQAPIITATITGNVHMLKFLLRNNAKIDMKLGSYGRPAVYYAYYCMKEELQHQYQQCGEILLHHNADLQFVAATATGEKVTIFDAALEENHFDKLKPVVAHLGILKALGKPIIDRIWSQINSHESLKRYFEKCEEMLKEKITDRIKVFNLLTSDKKKMARYLNDGDVIRNLRFIYDRLKVLDCGYYCQVLNKRCLEGDNYKKLKDKAATMISRFFRNRIHETHLIIDNVVDHLDDRSLEVMSRLYLRNCQILK